MIRLNKITFHNSNLSEAMEEGRLSNGTERNDPTDVYGKNKLYNVWMRLNERTSWKPWQETNWRMNVFYRVDMDK